VFIASAAGAAAAGGRGHRPLAPRVGLPTLPLGKVAETCHELIIYSALKTLWEKHEY